MKRAWYYFIAIFGFTEKARLRAWKRLEKPMPPHPTGVCFGCGVNLFDGTNFCSDECKTFYLEEMESYGNQ
jgi:hypothetical protein